VKHSVPFWHKVFVVNIDNGFGAACIALLINHL
jgi:NCAIR mutase (PurE)-related protein